MEFRNLANALIRTVYADMNTGEAVREIFLDITCEGDDQLALYDISIATYRGYLVEGHGISQAARIAAKCLDKEKLAETIYDQPDNIIEQLLEDVEALLPEAESANIGECISNALASIITSSLNRKRPKPHTPKKNEKRAEKRNSPREEAALVIETGGRCPLCGKPICKIKDGAVQGSEIVSITPLVIKQDQRKAKPYQALVDKMPIVGSLDDRIALCLDCAHKYKTYPTPERFVKVYKAKNKIRETQELIEALADFNLEQNVLQLLTRLGKVEEFGELHKLPMKAVKVRRKIHRSNALLIVKIETLVVRYYNTIREQGRLLEAQGDLNFSLLANEIRGCYLMLKNSGFDQEEIFDHIVKWIYEKSGWEKSIECELLAAFFVQNCEVFDEITE